MARSEIQGKVDMVSCADFILQKRYMSTPPRKVDVYDDDEFDDGGSSQEGQGEMDDQGEDGTFRLNLSSSKRSDSLRKSTERSDKSAGDFRY